MTDMVRRHITLPRKLAEDFERLVGERNQSAEIAALIQRRLENERLLEAFDRLGRSPKAPHPDWDTAEARERWIDEIRTSRDIDQVSER